MSNGPEHQDPFERWRKDGFKPELIFNTEGKWAVQFNADAKVPAWADSTDKKWRNTPEEAIVAALMDEQSQEGYVGAIDPDKT